MAASVGVKHGAIVPGPDSPDVLSRVQEGLAIVDSVSRRFSRELGGSLELEDLKGDARIALLAAARAFDPSRGLPFAAYASFRIRYALFDVVRQMALPRRTYERLRTIEEATRMDEGRAEDSFAAQPQPSAPSSACRLGELIAATASAMALGIIPETAMQADGERVGIERSDPEQELSRAQLNALVLRLVDDLPGKEGKLVRRHYYDGVPFVIIAKELTISRFWVCRLHCRAIARLTKQIARAS